MSSRRISLDEAMYRARVMKIAFMTLIAPVTEKKTRVQLHDIVRGEILLPNGHTANVDAIKATGGEWLVEDLTNSLSVP
jgi:hypothetical protein